MLTFGVLKACLVVNKEDRLHSSNVHVLVLLSCDVVFDVCANGPVAVCFSSPCAVQSRGASLCVVDRVSTRSVYILAVSLLERLCQSPSEP